MPTFSDRPCALECGDMASGNHALPMDMRRVEIVDNDYAGEWVGVPCCERCFNVHAAAGVKGLDAYLKATESLRDALNKARVALRSAAGTALQCVEEIGENPWP